MGYEIIVEETGALRTNTYLVYDKKSKEAALFDVGDKIKIGGGIRKATKHFPRILNVEFIQVLNLVKKYRKTNPLCRKCNKRMKSKGKNQSFECIKCKNKLDSKQTETISRNIQEKLYLPIISSQRHLTRPYQRQGKINKTKFNNSIPWFNQYKN